MTQPFNFNPFNFNIFFENATISYKNLEYIIIRYILLIIMNYPSIRPLSTEEFRGCLLVSSI